MPRLPLPFALPQGRLTPQPRGVAQVPVGRIPRVDVGAAGQTGAALGTLAAGLASGTELYMQGRAIEARRQEAQALLDSKSALQDSILAAQRWAEAQKIEGDWRTYPEDMARRFQDLEAQYGADLTPLARQHFGTELKQYQASVMPRFYAWRDGRQEQEKQYVLGQELEQIKQGFAQAGSAQELQYYEQRLHTTLDNAVSSGLADGAKAAAIPFAMRQDVAKLRAQQLNRTDPMGAWQHWQALMRGEAGTPGYPASDQPQLWADLADDAKQQALNQMAQVEHAERRAEHQMTKAQQALSMEYRSQIVQLDPSPQNLGAFQALLNTATTNRQALGDQEYTQLSALLRANINAAQQAREVDDPSTERALRLQIALADTAEDLRRAEEALIQQGVTALKPESFTALERLLTTRLDAATPSNRRSYRDGVTEIKRAAIVPESFGLAQLLGDETKQTLLQALDEYDIRYRALAQESLSRADQEALGLAREVRLRYFPPTAQTLPPEVQAVQSEAELGSVLLRYYQQGYPHATLEAWREAWRQGQTQQQTTDQYLQEQREKTQRRRQ